MAPDGRGRLHARPTLRSWPGIVHGGGVVALLAQSTSPPLKVAATVARSRVKIHCSPDRFAK